jgi:signal transduction histidine kinase
MRGELLKRLITAQEDERRRLARELHDELGQALSGLSLRVEALERLLALNPAHATDQIAPIRALIDETTGQMYRLIMDLRPSSLDDLGLEAALCAYAGRLFEGSPVQFDLDASALDQRLPPEVETTLYRVFQEALNNVLRHARARHVHIALAHHGDVLEASVADDGCGFEMESVNMNGQAAQGLGLLGMRERIAQCGGDMQIITHPGGGARLVIRLPLTGRSCE